MFELLNIIPTNREDINGAMARNRFDTETGESTIFVTKLPDFLEDIKYIVMVLCHEALHTILTTEIDIDTGYKLDIVDEGCLLNIGEVSYIGC